MQQERTKKAGSDEDITWVWKALYRGLLVFLQLYTYVVTYLHQKAVKVWRQWHMRVTYRSSIFIENVHQWLASITPEWLQKWMVQHEWMTGLGAHIAITRLKDGECRKKPNHLAILFDNLPCNPMMNAASVSVFRDDVEGAIRRAMRWCRVMGIPYLTLYDAEGRLVVVRLFNYV